MHFEIARVHLLINTELKDRAQLKTSLLNLVQRANIMFYHAVGRMLTAKAVLLK